MCWSRNHLSPLAISKKQTGDSPNRHKRHRSPARQTSREHRQDHWRETKQNQKKKKGRKNDSSVSRSVSIIQVHIKQRMYTSSIVLNSAGSYKWGKKKTQNYSFPLKKNVFALTVETEQTCKNKPNIKLPQSIQRHMSTSQIV